MLFAAATDHRYLDGGHTLDFVNKALEALDIAGWERRRGACSRRCRRSSRSPSGWRRRTPGGTPSTSSRCSSGPSRSCRRARGSGAARGWTAAPFSSRRCSTANAAAIARRAARGAARGRDRGRARLGRRVRGRDADRAVPDEQRVRRLGHRAPHVHVRERGRAGAAPLALARAAPRRPRRRR